MGLPTHYPLSLGRIFELGRSIFRFAWRTMWAAAAICLVPAYALMASVATLFSPRVNLWLAETERAARLGLAPPSTPPGFDVALIALLAAAIVLLLASLLAVAAIVRVVDAVYRGERVSAVGAVRDAAGRLLSLVGAQLLYLVAAFVIILLGLSVAAVLLVGGGIATFLGLVALVSSIVAILFVAVRASLVTPAVVIDRVGGVEGFGRSWRLVSGSGWRVFGYVILIGLISGLLGLILGGVPSVVLHLVDTSAIDVALGTFIDALVALLVAPLSPIVITLLYYDLRWQHGERVPLPGGGETTGRPDVASA